MKKLIAATLMIAMCHASVHGARELIIEGGNLDRTNTIVIFKPPELSQLERELFAQGNLGWELVSGDTRIFAQSLPGGRAGFILGQSKAGETKTYLISPVKATGQGVTLQRDGNHLTFTISNKQVLRYNGDKTPLPQGIEPVFARGGYIHPVLTPAGKLVTDDYPIKHKHHHGIWFPWTKTQFEGRAPDFWNMGQKTGTVEFVELVSTFSGPVAAGFTSKHRMIDLSAQPNPKPAINETWDVIVYRVDSPEKPMYVFDMTSTHTCASESPLILPKYHYGGVGFRGHAAWDGKDNAQFITSEGKTRADGNETTGRWVHIGGQVPQPQETRSGGPRQQAVAGVAILCHPTNFRFPQPLRIHPTEPFVCYAPQQAGEMKIEPGKPYISKYRYIVTDGKPDTAQIDRLWNDYASPPQVTVK